MSASVGAAASAARRRLKTFQLSYGRRVTPQRPAFRISLSTLLRPTPIPNPNLSSAHTLGLP
jgi:hypothetical protein